MATSSVHPLGVAGATSQSERRRREDRRLNSYELRDNLSRIPSWESWDAAPAGQSVAGLGRCELLTQALAEASLQWGRGCYTPETAAEI